MGGPHDLLASAPSASSAATMRTCTLTYTLQVHDEAKLCNDGLASGSTARDGGQAEGSGCRAREGRGRPATAACTWCERAAVDEAMRGSKDRDLNSMRALPWDPTLKFFTLPTNAEIRMKGSEWPDYPDTTKQ